MAILQSCCFWRSVRKGSYASAIYTAAYFGVIVAVMSMFVDEERRYFLEGEGEEEGEEEVTGKPDGVDGSGEGDIATVSSSNKTSHTPKRPMTQSFLEPEGISGTTMYFNVIVLACACCGFIASLLLCCGLYVDNRLLLIPWILIVVITSLVDLLHIMYLMILESTSFNPLTSIVFTIDFFLLSINIYCLLCVVSQYQEYKAGRGTAQYEAFTARVRKAFSEHTPLANACVHMPSLFNFTGWIPVVNVIYKHSRFNQVPVIRYEAPRGTPSIMSSKKTTLPGSSTVSPATGGPPLSILLTTVHEGKGLGQLSPAAAAAEAAIAADIEARGAAVEDGDRHGGTGPSEGKISFVGAPGGVFDGVEDEVGGIRPGGERWGRKKKRGRPPKRVQFPLHMETKGEAVSKAEEGRQQGESTESGHKASGPFILEGGHLPVGETLGQSAMLFLSSSSITAAAAVVVANDSAPLLSPNPPPLPINTAKLAFFSGSGSHHVDS